MIGLLPGYRGNSGPARKTTVYQRKRIGVLASLRLHCRTPRKLCGMRVMTTWLILRALLAGVLENKVTNKTFARSETWPRS